MIEKIIVKREPKRNGNGLIFFFPESLIDDKIMYYAYAENVHGECLLAYYKECKHEYSQGDDVRIPLSMYTNSSRILPDCKNLGYERIYRINSK